MSFSEDKPLYMQLYGHIRSLVQDGILESGAKLPSIRSMMQQLNISKTTVETAYHMLLEEGYVTSRERSGLFVAGPASIEIKESRQRDEGWKTEIKTDKTCDIDFNLLAVDGESFPMKIWKSALNKAVSMNRHTIHEYGDPQGEYTFRECIARYLLHSRGVVCTPEQIIVGSGIAYSLNILARLTETGAAVGFEKHGIAQVQQHFLHQQFRLVPVILRESEELERKLDGLQLLYVTPSHRPSGEPLPYGMRQYLLQWAYQKRRFIIEDDYDGELRLFGRPVPSLQGLDKHGTVIYIGTFSKAFSPALRLNYMVIPNRLLRNLDSVNQILACPSRIDQWAMQLFIEEGHWYRHLRRIRRVYRTKHDTLVELLRSHFADAIHVTSSGIGLHVELTIADHLADHCSAKTLVELAQNEGVRVYGSHELHLDSDEGTRAKIYLGFGGINERDMERGVRLLKKAWSTVLA